jgi:hypothetical protein
MVTFVYRCPVLGLNVQGYVADDPSEKMERDRYRNIVCDGCGFSHLVNPVTGETPFDSGDE